MKKHGKGYPMRGTDITKPLTPNRRPSDSQMALPFVFESVAGDGILSSGNLTLGQEPATHLLQSVEGLPRPFDGERPSSYADRIGEWYVSTKDDQHRKHHGLYLTP